MNSGSINIRILGNALWAPQGGTCTVTEALPASGTWGPPSWSITNIPSGWTTPTILTGANDKSISVYNHPQSVWLNIKKDFVGVPIFGAYVFNITCSTTGTTASPSGLYLTRGIRVTVPSPGTSSLLVPKGYMYAYRSQPSGTGWTAPTWSAGTGSPIPASGWATHLGRLNSDTTLIVTQKEFYQIETYSFLSHNN